MWAFPKEENAKRVQCFLRGPSLHVISRTRLEVTAELSEFAGELMS
jgi:hypothetical protein